MAFLLRFDGVNDRVEIANGLTLSNVGDYIEIDVDFESTDNTQFLMGNRSGAFDQFLIYDTTRWRMRVFSGIAEIFVSLPSGRTTVRLELTSSGYELFYNGVSQGAFSQPAGFSPTLIGAWAGGSGYADIDLYGLIRATSTATLNNYDPSASNGTGSILDDTVGGNDGTLINFPADDSQWVFFDDGGGITADAAFDISAPTFAATASASVPTPTSDVNFTIPAPTFASSASATLPQPTSNIAFDIAAPEFSVSASATLSQPVVDIGFNIPAPTFSVTGSSTQPNPIASASFTISAPVFSLSAEVTLPSPDATVIFDIPAPTFAVTGSVTEPVFNANVAFSIPAPTFSASATASLPQPSADVGFTISAPTFSVVAIVGGIAIIVDEETNITLPALSNNITLQALSNNIDL